MHVSRHLPVMSRIVIQFTAYSFHYFQGKPVAEAKGEVDFAASFIEWYAAEGRRNYGEIIEFPVATSRSMVRKEPIGVAGIIVPVSFKMPCLCFSDIYTGIIFS